MGKLELDASSPREPTGLFISHRSVLVPLFLSYRESPSFCLLFSFLCFSLGQSFFQSPAFLHKHIVPSPVVAHVSSGYLPSGSRESSAAAGKGAFCFASSFSCHAWFPVVEHFQSNIYCSSLVGQWLENQVLSLLWHGFDSWPENFHMLWMPSK